MAIITYEIEPGGDMYLVLKDPNSQNIVPIIGKGVQDNNSDTFDNPPLVGRYEVFNKVIKDASVDGLRELPFASTTDITEVHMRVSSRHLILASRTFRNMLEGGWSESFSGKLLFGLRLIETSGWDAAALAIVLDTVHGRHCDIPKYTNLGLLTRIATIVDYYEFHESLQLIGDIWVATLRAACAVPTKLCQSTLLWLYISWVFSEKDVISRITKMLLEQSDSLDGIDSLDLPVGGVLDIIQIKRNELINTLVNGLGALRRTLEEEKVCLRGSGDSICSATMLGILVRELRKITLGLPLESPYDGHSISNLKERIANFPVPRQDHRYHNSHNGYYQDMSACTIHSRMGAVLKEIDDDIKSFDLTTQE